MLLLITAFDKLMWVRNVPTGTNTSILIPNVDFGGAKVPFYMCVYNILRICLILFISV